MYNFSKFILSAALLIGGFSGTVQAEVIVGKDAYFSQTVSTGIVVVDFYATWCGPCKKFAPIFDEISNEMDGVLGFVKCNLDDCANTMKAHNVQSFPTIILFKDGVEVARATSFMDKAKFRSFIQNNM